MLLLPFHSAARSQLSTGHLLIISKESCFISHSTPVFKGELLYRPGRGFEFCLKAVLSAAQRAGRRSVSQVACLFEGQFSGCRSVHRASIQRPRLFAGQLWNGAQEDAQGGRSAPQKQEKEKSQNPIAIPMPIPVFRVLGRDPAGEQPGMPCRPGLFRSSPKELRLVIVFEPFL